MGQFPMQSPAMKNGEKILDSLKGKVGKAERNDALGRFADPSLPERFRFYLAQRKLDASLVAEFRFAREARTDVVHGRARAISFGDADRAEKLLRALLRSEVGVQGELPADRHPRIREAIVEWMFDRSGQRHRGTGASGASD
jgi:hypothetical protein